jgi:hypothetical protein
MEPEDPILDPLVHLGFVAAATRRVLLATGIIILAQRNPLVLAKQAATLDVLSGGRLLLGVGAGRLLRTAHAADLGLAVLLQPLTHDDVVGDDDAVDPGSLGRERPVEQVLPRGIAIHLEVDQLQAQGWDGCAHRSVLPTGLRARQTRYAKSLP